MKKNVKRSKVEKFKVRKLVGEAYLELETFKEEFIISILLFYSKMWFKTNLNTPKFFMNRMILAQNLFHQISDEMGLKVCTYANHFRFVNQ